MSSNLFLHVPATAIIDRIEYKDLAASLQWAIGLAEEAIAVREAGDDEEDTPEIIAMHRAELDKARKILARLQDEFQ